MNNPNDFKLIETMLWEKGDFFLLDLHLSRLERSADEFSFFCNLDEVRKVLSNVSRGFDPSHSYKVRFTVTKQGELDMSCTPLSQKTEEPVKLILSEKSIDKSDIFLRHKTTKRGLYNSELERVRELGFYDAVFSNQDGEITEGCISNIVIKNRDEYFTPPVSSGVLPGVYRQFLLEKNDFPLKEKVLYKEDLLNADNIFVANSVVTLLPAIFPSDEKTP